MKKINRINLIQIVLSTLFCFSVMITATGCGEQDKSGSAPSISSDIESSRDNSESSKENKEQIHSFLIPKSLLGGTDGEDAVSDFNDSSATVLLESGEEVPIKSVYMDIIANKDGTATYSFTEEQLQSYLYETACTATLSRVINKDSSVHIPNTSIKSTEFTDDDLTGIIVYVDSSRYEKLGTDGILANLFTATYMGLYQVMSGVDPYEWHVHVTVKDYETGEIITEEDYPTDR